MPVHALTECGSIMALAPGDRFGSYEVLGLAGAGGMGEVYRAHDARLGREVALKVLPDERRLDAEAQQRLEREARLLASLNHPNIATLHGIEVTGDAQALVMELVDGSTLDERRASAPRSRLSVGESVEIARQIAAALEAAHERGVVHRDLKPANVKVRRDGTVKVLDFGIAKALERGALSGAATLTSTTGASIGTPAYMSPEQARGSAVDRRTDLWAFGCVLYEMLTGTRAFEGETSTDTLARVIEREPDWSRLPADVPAGLRAVLERCLEKDPRRRQRDAGDLGLDLERACTPEKTRPARRWPLVAAAAIGVVLAAGGFAALQFGPRALPAAPVVRFAVQAPQGGRFETPLLAGSGAPVGGAVSPDGRKLAFTASGAAGVVELWVRSLDSLEAQALPGTEQAALPFWSPDGNSLGFFADARLQRVDVAGGTSRELTGIVRGSGGAWGADGTIIFAANLRGALSRVDAAGGEVRPATTLAEGHRAHRFPYLLPDGKHFLFFVEGETPAVTGVFVASLDDATTSRRLLAADSAAVYAEPGFLLLVRQRELFAQPFDIAALELTGEPVQIAQSVSSEAGAPAFSVGGSVLSYRSGVAESEAQQLVWFDRAGRELQTVGAPGTYRGVDLSPDGTRVAVHNHQANGGDIWIFEPRGTTTRVTFDPVSDNSSPVWSPDGTRIAFGALRDGRWGLYAKDASGEGGEQLLTESALPKIPASWSPDGSMIAYWLYDPDDGTHQWVLPLDGDAPPRQLFDSSAHDGHSQISPDGQWIAYMSTPTGRTEIYVRPFPAGDGVWQISTSGGVTPRWRYDGRELFFMSSYDHGKLMAVELDAEGDQLVPGTPRELFAIDMAIVPHSTVVPNFHTYAVAPDGERFVIPMPVSALRGERAGNVITVVLNWTALADGGAR
jgi:Tol biopolymer transport system component